MKHAQHRLRFGLYGLLLSFGCSDGPASEVEVIGRDAASSDWPDAASSPPSSGDATAATNERTTRDSFTPLEVDGETGPEAEAVGDAGAFGPDASGFVRDGATSSSDAEPHADFVCSWVLGIHTTYEWFSAGFEQVVDDARWEVSGIEMAQFGWADPNSALWASPVTSPCTASSKTPDRIVFCGVDTDSTTVQQFLPKYVSVVNIVKSRFPSVKRIDLMTLARAPGNMECIGANRSGSSYIKAAQDEAIAMTVNMFPGFVYSTPKWEVMSCSDFGLCPHISAAANKILAKTMGEYFLTH